MKIHNLSAGIFSGVLLPYIATSTYTDWYFVGGSPLLGLTFLIAPLLSRFPDRGKPSVDFNLPVVLLGVGLNSPSPFGETLKSES